MAYWLGTTKTSYTLTEGITFGPGNNPTNYKWIVRAWFGSKYLELARDLPGNANTTVPLNWGSQKGNALMRVMGGSRSITTSKINAIMYDSGNWSDSGGNHQVFTMDLPNVTFTIPDDGLFNPKLSASFSLINALNGQWVQNKTTALITSTAEAAPGASIKGVANTFTADGDVWWGESVTKTTPITKAGTFQIKTETQDTRKLRKEIFTTINVLPYHSPRINTFTLQRCNSSGALDANGTYAKVTYNYEVKNISGNTATAVFQYLNGSTWTSIKTLTGSTGNSSFVTGNICPTNTETQFRVILTDKFESVTHTGSITPARAWMGFSQQGNAMVCGREYNPATDAGKTITARPFVAESHAYFDKKLIFNTAEAIKSLVDRLYPIGISLPFKEGVNPNTLFPGTTWQEMANVIESTITSGQCINNSDCNASNGGKVAMYQMDGTFASKWRFYLAPLNDAGTSIKTPWWLRTA